MPKISFINKFEFINDLKMIKIWGGKKEDKAEFDFV
jgi:hypothetical protein